MKSFEIISSLKILEVNNYTKNPDTLSDEIALRDEILRLKRELMVLKRTNEQYLVKLRKYEDEAKRKDKQVEQLMDPRKNADITKVLSTKGAAILMNLKDQNEALIQMILNKDLQIRRLVAEIKMSKLYATTRKNESYRTEINRLRNLLLKSQEALKESEVHQPTKTVCASGNSLLEFSSSSDQSSPRDLDELRVTILSLESHIKHSNDLLVKKNQEISLLSNELNFLKKFLRYKTYKNKAFEGDANEQKNYKFSMEDFTQKWSEPSTKIFVPEPLRSTEKNQQENSFTQTVPPAPSNWFSTFEYSPKRTFHSEQKDNPTEENLDSVVTIKTHEENFEKVSILGKSLYHNLAANEILKEEKILSHPRTIRTKEKWVKALKQYKIVKKLKPEIFMDCKVTEKAYNDRGIVEDTEFPGSEYNSKEIVEKADHEKPEDISVPNDNTAITPTSVYAASDNEESKTGKNSTSPSVPNDDSCPVESISLDETRCFKKQSPNEENSTENAKENSGTVQDGCYPNEAEESEIKSFRNMYYKSQASSFDSESSSSMKQEFHQMKVEVEINTVSLPNDDDRSVSSVSDNNLTFESGREDGGNDAHDVPDFNDDDDVIVREK